MSGEGDSRRWKPPIGAADKVAFLTALRGGAPRHAAAAAAGGYALNSFYRVARGDPVFKAGWEAAHAVSAAAERGWPITGYPGADCPSTGLPLHHPSGGPPSPSELGEEWLGEE